LFQPESYLPVLSLMILSMLCWGSWANTMKLCPGYRFQLFYWDYIWGLIAGALLWGFTLGSIRGHGPSFLADLAQTSGTHIGFALLSGALFNIANLLLVAAIEIAGLAVAFPVGIGLALIVGAIASYILLPKGNPLLLFGGIALVIAAIAFDAVAYRLRETDRRSLSVRGVIISLIAGLLMGSFYPFVARAMSGQRAGGPYAITFVFVLGVLLCAVPFNVLLMRKPPDGSHPLIFSDYTGARHSWHLWGVLGGLIWCTGALFNFVSSRAHAVGPAVSYSIGQGATMISAAWGVFVWKEFAGAPQRSKRFLTWMFIFFLAGLCAIALAPVLWK